MEVNLHIFLLIFKYTTRTSRKFSIEQDGGKSGVAVREKEENPVARAVE
jgi:hypothetical protein